MLVSVVLHRDSDPVPSTQWVFSVPLLISLQEALQGSSGAGGHCCDPQASGAPDPQASGAPSKAVPGKTEFE
jgi:hypothetical protein